MGKAVSSRVAMSLLITYVLASYFPLSPALQPRHDTPSSMLRDNLPLDLLLQLAFVQPTPAIPHDRGEANKSGEDASCECADSFGRPALRPISKSVTDYSNELTADGILSSGRDERWDEEARGRTYHDKREWTRWLAREVGC